MDSAALIARWWDQRLLGSKVSPSHDPMAGSSVDVHTAATIQSAPSSSSSGTEKMPKYSATSNQRPSTRDKESNKAVQKSSKAPSSKHAEGSQKEADLTELVLSQSSYTVGMFANQQPVIASVSEDEQSVGNYVGGSVLEESVEEPVNRPKIKSKESKQSTKKKKKHACRIT